MTAYYNEIDLYCAEWLRNLIREGLIPDGYVDTRSIADVRPADLHGFAQCHFFAGLGGWGGALRLAGWPDNREVWTGSCPCQPFSVAGRQGGFADERHLWPYWFHIIAQRRPPVVLGEQVASAAEWLRLVRGDLEAMGYAVGAIPVEAASAGADHLRDRYWFVADADDAGSQGWRVLPERPGERTVGSDGMGHAIGEGQLQQAGTERTQRRWLGDAGDVEHAESKRVHRGESAGRQTGWPSTQDAGVEWVIGADGKARRVKPGVRLLAHGVPARVAKLRALGNAIDLRPAAAFIKAVM